MKFVKLSVITDKATFTEKLSNNEFVNSGVKFSDNGVRPIMKTKLKGDRVTIGCEMIGGPRKDNGFLEGTKLFGRLSERDGIVTLRGVVLTAPIYHFLFLCLTVFFVFQCFRLGGFSVVPICLIIFDLFMFKDEFKKQRLLYNYVFRAAKRVAQIDNKSMKGIEK